MLATITTLCLAGQLRDRLAAAEKRLFLTAWHLERLGKQATRPDSGHEPPHPRPPPRTASPETA